MKRIPGLAAAACALACASTASATILTFEQSSGGVATDATPTAIAGDYGDRVTETAQNGYAYGVGDEGFTGNVQVGFGSPDPRVVSGGFGDLQDVLFENTPSEDPIIGLAADDGFLVTLFDFEIAAQGGDFVVDQIVVFDEAGLLFEVSDVQLFASGSETIDLAALAGGPLTGRSLDIRIVLDSLGADSRNVAIDNLRFGQVADAVAAIPLPGAAVLLLTGAAGLIAARRRG